MDKQKSSTIRSVLITLLVVVVVIGAGVLIGRSGNSGGANTASLIDTVIGDESTVATSTIPSGPTADEGDVNEQTVPAQTNITFISPSSGETLNVGSTYSVLWKGGTGSIGIALVPMLPENVTVDVARNSVAIAAWELLPNSGSASITIPTAVDGNYQFIAYDEFGAVVSDSFVVAAF